MYIYIYIIDCKIKTTSSTTPGDQCGFHKDGQDILQGWISKPFLGLAMKIPSYRKKGLGLYNGYIMVI